MKRHLFLAVTSIVLLASQGRSEINLDPLKVTPSLSVDNRYDDNVLLDPNNSVKSYLAIISPGLAARLPFDRSQVSVDYRADILRYQNQPGANDTVEHTLNSAVNLRSAKNYGLDLTNSYVRTSDPPDSELTGRIPHHDDTARAGVNVPVGYRFVINGAYQYFDTGYEDPTLISLLNRHEQLVTAMLNTRLYEKTFGFFEYDRGLISFADSSIGKDSKYDQFQGGVEETITAMLKATFKVGVQDREYLAPPGDTPKTTIGSLQFDYTPDSFTKLSVSGVRTVQESSEDIFYRANYFRVDSSRRFAPRWTAILGGGYDRNAYPTPVVSNGVLVNRVDNVWRVRPGIEFDLNKYLVLGAYYQREIRTSNVSGYEYKDNICDLAIRTRL